MLTIQEIQKLSEKDLSAELIKTQHELTRVRLQIQNGQSKETHNTKLLRKQIARLNTVKNSLKSSK